MAVIFSEAGRTALGGLSPAASPRSQGHPGYWVGPLAGQPLPTTAEELTRELAGWSLPPAAPLGGASATWLW